MRASAIWYRCLPSKAVPASQARDSVCTAWPLAGSKATSCVPAAAQTLLPSWLTPCTRPSPPKGPYSRTISAGCNGASVGLFIVVVVIGFLSCAGFGAVEEL